jgi:DNA recombination protein RmuC
MVAVILVLLVFILIALCALIWGVYKNLQQKVFDPSILPPSVTPEALNFAERRLIEQLELVRRTTAESDASQRQELNLLLKGSSESLVKGVEKLGVDAKQHIHEVQRLVSETLPGQVDKSVKQRFDSDFALVRESLENVRQRLSTIEYLNKGVADLNGSVTRFSQMLGNVKSRGTWGEYQLGSLLADILTPSQYAQNVHPNPRAPRRVVEFAIALPGQQEGERVWLPIDSKFPQEDYERLLIASDAGDREAMEAASTALVKRVKSFANDVRDAYVMPPHTTDFAILFLPTEGLYLEVLRYPGIVDEIQRQSKVLLAGPMTLSALLSALRLGFRTLAVQKNTVEVMKTLQRVKQALEGFEKQQSATLKALQTAVTTTERETSRLQTLRTALQSVEAVSEELSIMTDEEETQSYA